MPAEQLRLAPEVPDLTALGASGFDDFFAEPPRLVTAARARRDGSAWRLPLPGTPDEHGRVRERPRGAGTGWIAVRAWRGGGLDRWRARLVPPRSSSLAARQWNLICHLHAHGLGAPAPIALGERGGVLAARESFLVVRELEGHEPLARWFARTRDRAERERALRALSLSLAALWRSGAHLPATTLEGVEISVRDAECAAAEIRDLRDERVRLRERRLERSRLPSIAFTRFEGGRLGVPATRRAIARRLRSLWRGFEHLAGDDERAALFDQTVRFAASARAIATESGAIS